MHDAPIGIFDSGLGGLSVLKSIYQQMPSESFIYIADSRYVPYGEKSTPFIRERCEKITNYLISQQVKAIVIACNTATAAAANILREQNPQLPIIAMEPAIKPARQLSKTGKIGVLATSSTLKSTRFTELVNRFAYDLEIHAQPCPGLVECIEKGELNTKQTEVLLQSYITPLLTAGCDTIILGCTHYPFLRPLLAQLLPSATQLIDSGEGVAKHLHHLLTAQQKLSTAPHNATISMCTTGELTHFKNVLVKLWPHHITITQQISL